MDGLFNYFGITLNYLGGGTGSLQFAPFPSLICNEGVVSAAALVGWAPLETFIGVAHGWEAISDPLRITSYNVCYTKLLRIEVNRISPAPLSCSS